MTDESGSRKDHLRNTAGEVRKDIPAAANFNAIAHDLERALEKAQEFEKLDATAAVIADIEAAIAAKANLVRLCEDAHDKLDALFVASELPD